MADISSQLKDIIQRINTAVRGEDVRDAIIEAINLLKTGDGNAYSLNGHPASYFATQDDMDKILPMDATPTQYSQRPVSSGGLYNLLEDMLYVIDQYINKESVSGSLIDRLEYLDETRRLIRNEIIAKNVSVDKDDTFRSYANKIKSIETHSEVSVSSVEITESNLEYDETKEEYTGEFDPGENQAYKPVTVKIKPSLAELTITKNGEYKASDQNAVGFSKIKVDISEESGSSDLTTKKITSEDLPDEPKEVTFKAKDEQKIGYSQVSVDVSGKFGPKDLDIDPTSYGEQQIYEAKDDGLYGWSKIIVTIKESTGPFTVKFYSEDGSQLIQTVSNVPKGGVAVCTNKIPDKKGYYFKGWNPSPNNVIKDMDCYAQYAEDTNPIGYDSEIPESWEEIAANNGVNVPIGAYKILYYASFEYDGITYPGGSLVMQKVCAGEGGTTSTWLSMNALGHYGTTYNSYFRMYTNKCKTKNEEANGWPNSDLRQFLNNGFKNAVYRAAEESSIVPKSNSAIIGAAKSVKKYSTSYDQHVNTEILNAESSDTIWIPSLREAGWKNSQNWFVETAGSVYTRGKTEAGTPVTPPGYYSYANSMWIRTTPWTGKITNWRNSYTLKTIYSWDTQTTINSYVYNPDYDRDEKQGDTGVVVIGFCT